MSEVIRISDSTYEKLMMLSDGTGASISTLASGLIEKSLSPQSVDVKTISRQVLVFKK